MIFVVEEMCAQVGHHRIRWRLFQQASADRALRIS
jgi:hypothetical protein